MTTHDRTGAARPARPARRWSRTVRTREVILEAARTVFLEHGYADAGMSDIVKLAESSTGSIYHHFGGKAELYLALWEEHEHALRDAARDAVQAARSSDDDPVQLFLVGARAYLEQAWRDHQVAKLFSAGDSPPGFETLRRSRAQEWIRQNTQLLGASEEPVARVLVSVLSSMVADGAWEVSECRSPEEAELVIEATLTFIRKVAV
jgi:AcrR family transcriptional regulator